MRGVIKEEIKMKSINKILLVSFIFQYHNSHLFSQTLSSTYFKIEPTDSMSYVAIYADGNIRGISSGSSSSNISGNGALGINVQNRNYSWTASINIASTNDTIKTDFGSLILNPMGGKSFSGFLDLRKRSFFTIDSYDIGLHLYLCTSKSLCLYNQTCVSAVASGWGATIYADVLNGHINENEISFGFESGVSFRWVAGNLTGENRKNLIGTAAKYFPGFEAGMQIKFGSIIAGLNGY